MIAVGSRTQLSAQAFADRHAIAAAYGSYEELVADPSVDVVYVATPHTAHLPVALLSLGAGNPTLVEKPLGATGMFRLISACTPPSTVCSTVPT
ncbi:MAG TPA: Gfo/Idh/MocA family oxidoreductase [Microlunatus sp.]